jgi:3-oxoacyl-[acyl-carrier protein] reductase
MSKGPPPSAIITGASRGIGRAVALRLARDGFAVVVNFSGNRGKAEEVVGEIERGGGRAVAVQANVAEPAEVARLFDAAEAAHGPVGVVVNSAGIMKLSPIATASVDDFDDVFAVNVRGTFNVLQQAAKRIADGGRIITMSTSVLGMSFPGYAPYAASKAAVEVLTRILAHELRGRGSTGSPSWPRWSRSAPPMTSPASSHFSPVRTAGGSVRRRYAPTAVIREGYLVFAVPIHTLVPAKAGTQTLPELRASQLDSRFRGNERKTSAQYPAARAPRVRGSAAPTKPCGVTRMEFADVISLRTLISSPRASSALIRSSGKPGSAYTRSGIH